MSLQYEPSSEPLHISQEYNISFYVNLFASISYFGKCLADSMGHNYSDVGYKIKLTGLWVN